MDTDYSTTTIKNVWDLIETKKSSTIKNVYLPLWHIPVVETTVELVKCFSARRERRRH